MQRQTRLNWQAMAVGLVATFACAAIYLAGGFEWLENKTLDLRFRYANSIPQSPDIVCVDINDGSLEEVGRWPWPRDLQAKMVAMLGELGARATLVDLEWNEPQAQREDEDPDIDLIEGPQNAASTERGLNYPDLELQAAVGRAGDVYVAYSTRPVALESAPEFNAAVDALLSGDKRRAADALNALHARRQRTLASIRINDSHIPERAALVADLQRTPGADRVSLPADSNLNLDVISDAEFERARVAAYTRIARQWLAENPDGRARFAFDIFPSLYEQWARRFVHDPAPTRHAWTLAFRAALGQEATLRDPLLPSTLTAPAARMVEGLVPTYYLIARAAHRRGFVTFEPDPDGIVRRLPIFQQYGDTGLSQLAFSLAFDLMGLKPEHIQVQPHQLRLRPPGRDELVIQLDREGQALVPWVPQGEWMRQFAHLATQRLWRVCRNRDFIENNRRAASGALRELLKLPAFERWRESTAELDAETELLAQIRTRRFERQFDVLHDLDDQLREIRTALDTTIAEILQSPSSAPATQSAPTDHDPAELLTTLRRVRAAEPDLENAVQTELGRLRPLVRGKLCLIGYTATSLADIKPIPTSPSTPGVSAHANLLNGLLTGRLVHWLAPGWNAAIAILLGALVAFLSTLLRPGNAAITLLAILLPFLAIALLAFYYWTLWIGIIPTVTAMIASFAAVSIFRYVFLDREQRHLATALSQYTSKQIAKQMAENPELCKIAEMRQVSAMFTDLRGFTSISERIGAQRTQKLLNICLQRLTEVMIRHEAMVNKFLGDGVFAFWNPVIYPQPEHATQACRSAIELQIAVEELKREQHAAGGDEAFEALSLRVGVAVGQAIVGPCGSEQKYDYTCIGDTVNLASRLESANKFFGTGILVNEELQHAVNGEFTFRPLGGVQVKGKLQSVRVYELLGFTAQITPDQLAHVAGFERGLGYFQKREWPAAIAAFEQCLQKRPDDEAANQYIALCRQYQETPPADDWDGGVELTEK